MTAGQLVDRALNAALIRLGDAANKLMELTLPMREDYSTGWADMLADYEAEHEVHEPRQTCDIYGCPPAVDDVAPPTGAGHMASASRTGTGGHPVRSTSELLDDAAHRITRAATSIGSADNPLIQEFVAELRDRAASFAAFGD